MKLEIIAAASIALLSSCVSTLPGPVKTDHVATEGAGFMLQGTPRRAHYATSYTFHDLSAGRYTAEVQFQNPSDDQAPFKVVKSFTYPTKSFFCESPPLNCIQSGKNYDVLLKLHRGSASGPVVDSHLQQVNFGFSRQMAAQLDLATRVE